MLWSRVSRVLMILGLSLSLGASWASAGESPAGPLAPPTLEQLQKLVQDQQALIARQQEALDGLERRLQQVESRVGSEPGPSVKGAVLPEPQAPSPPASAPSTVEQRLASLEQSVQKLPEFATPGDFGDFPGSFPIPGTDAALRVGGQVTYTGVQNLTALGTDDRFVTSSIPIAGTEAAGKTSRLTFSARPSKLNFDLRTPTGVGSMRAFVEADYAGDGNTFRLRHAFGQWRGFVIGQAWSTFSDPEAAPDGIDFEGLNAIALLRQAQVRWTHPVADRLKLSLSLEDPQPDVTGADGVSQVPDTVVRLRWEPERAVGLGRLLKGIGHLQGGVLIRQIRAEREDQLNTTLSAPGYGLNLSGRLNPGWWNDRDDVMLAVYTGRGIGRYITDLGEVGGLDAVYDPATDTLETLPVFSAYVGYEHWWNQRLRSTLTLGGVWIDTLDIQGPDALKETLRASFNLSWSPIEHIDLVGEFLTGRRINKDGQSGTAAQFQFGGRFRF